MRKLVVQFFIVGLLPLIIMGGLTYYFSKSALETKSLNQIESVNSIKKEHTVEFLKDRVNNVTLLSRSQHLRNMINYQTYQGMSVLFDYYMKMFGYSDILLLNHDGRLLYSAIQNKEFDDETESQEEVNQTITGIWERVNETNEPVLTDIKKVQNQIDPALFIGAPVYGDIGDLAAVLIVQINATRITELMSDKTGMGETGETYLVGSDDAFMRSKPRLFKGGTAILKIKVDKQIMKKDKETIAVNKGGSITKAIDDYDGKRVLMAVSNLDLKTKLSTDFDWVIITQKHKTEAFNLINKLLIIMGIIFSILIFVVGIIGYVQSTLIARPINDLSYKIVLLNDGDFTVELPEQRGRQDEIGLLIKSFNDGTKKTRKQMKMLMDSTNLLVSSISRISTTASQLASSASETSSSISEVTTTVEQVRQTSEVATEKAEHVAKSADNTNKISQAGKTSTENTMAGVNRIKGEMNYIAESTVQLSDQTKSIEEIINSVSDIADQSNILSVNAAIEAAKAGEHGKGFAVVAQEVKSLADQSKESTNQVRTILEDIQKATSAAVMATERGTKTVNEAVELAEQAGNAIDRLSTKVTESSDAAMQITASNQQQLSGMDQLSQAMESINDATQQNLDGVKQLEDALKGLEDLVHTMRDITSSYKI